MRRQLAHALLRACSAAGILLGLYWGYRHQPHVHCAGHAAPGAAINRCTSHVLSGLALHWGVALGGGLAVGAAIGLIAVLLIRPRTQRAVR
jgi:hypothetical protein